MYTQLTVSGERVVGDTGRSADVDGGAFVQNEETSPAAVAVRTVVEPRTPGVARTRMLTRRQSVQRPIRRSSVHVAVAV